MDHLLMYMLCNAFRSVMRTAFREINQKILAITCSYDISGIKVTMGNPKTVKVVHQLEYLASVEGYYIIYTEAISTTYRSDDCNCSQESRTFSCKSRIRMSMFLPSNMP